MRPRLWICLLAIVLILCMVQTAPADLNFNIAICTHQSFQPFELAREGFLNGLAEMGYKDRIHIAEDINAQSNIKNLEASIAALGARKDIDLIFALGTHSTKRLVKSIDHTPIIFTMVGDPVGAGIVTDWKRSAKNYTGVETPDYYSTVVRLMHHYVPFKSLGMIYLAGSPSHEAGIRQIIALSRELGFDFIKEGFPLRDQSRKKLPRSVIRNNIESALSSVCPRVEAFFVQTSNAFSNNFDLFHAAFTSHRLVSAGDPTNIEKGLVMGIGKNARQFGNQSAVYAIRILEGADPGSLPMDVGSQLSIDVNLEAAKAIGFEPPFELLSAADNLFQNISDPKAAKND